MALTVVCEPSGKSRRTFEAVLRLFGYLPQPLQADPRIALLVVGHSEHVHLHASGDKRDDWRCMCTGIPGVGSVQRSISLAAYDACFDPDRFRHGRFNATPFITPLIEHCRLLWRIIKRVKDVLPGPWVQYCVPAETQSLRLLEADGPERCGAGSPAR